PDAPRGLDEQQRLAAKPPLEIAREFEALLFAEMIAAMRRTVPESELGGGSAHRLLDGVFDQELARSLTARADLGLADRIAGQITQSGAHTTPPGRLPVSSAAPASAAADPARAAAQPAVQPSGAPGGNAGR